MWRDGENAIKIQTAVCDVARARLFDLGTGEALFKKSVFPPANIGLPLPASMAHRHTTLPW